MFETREDGPNTTATNRSLAFNDKVGGMSYYTEDTTLGGVPSRIIDNIEINTDEANMSKVPEYLKAGVRSEIDSIQGSGRQQLVVNSPESPVLKQVAAEVGADYSETNGRSTLTPNAKQPNSVLSDSFSTASAITAGYTEEDVRGLLSSKGYDEEQIQRILADATGISQARQAGYDDEEIQQLLVSRQTKVETANSEPVVSEDSWSMVKPNKAFTDMISGDELSIEEVVNNLEVLSPKATSSMTSIAGFFGNEEAAKRAEEATLASRERIISLAAQDGIQLQWDENFGQFFAQTEQGLVPVDQGFFRDSEKGLFAGGIAGALGGAYAGGAAGAALGPLGVAAGGFIGSVAGAAVGAYAGASYDYYESAIEMQQELEANRLMKHAFNQAELSVITDIAFLGAGKALKFGSGVTAKGFARAKDYILDGNSKGAYDALKKLEFLNDSQAQEIVDQLGRLANIPGKKAEEQAIAAVAVTKPGAEGLVHAVATTNPQASRAVAQAINTRAQDVLKATEELSGDNLSRILREDLGNYAADVKQFYGDVKATAAQSPQYNNFRFDYDALAITPVLNQLQKNIGDPAILERFMLQAQRAKSFSDSRGFSDLLELRQIVNEFKFNKKITQAKDFDALNKVLGNIDGAIDNGARVVMENPTKWKNDYGLARQQYAKMKQLERNVMFQALTREGINADEVTEGLAKYITSLDGTFNDLVTKLPKDMKARVENSVIDTLANRYTAGVGDGGRAINFPMLADDLNKVQFVTKDARRMKEALVNMSETFKNDVNLAKITGHIQVDKFQSFLTTDPVARAKYEIASQVFNKIKTLAPGQKANTLALVNKTSKLLENPLNAKSIKELMDEAAGSVDISKEALKLQQEAARAAASGKDQTAGRIKLYGTSVLRTKGAGPVTEIPVHRIASTDTARKLADQSGISFTDKKLMDQLLKSNGYKAVQQGSDAVRLLK